MKSIEIVYAQSNIALDVLRALSGTLYELEREIAAQNIDGLLVIEQELLDRLELARALFQANIASIKASRKTS